MKNAKEFRAIIKEALNIQGDLFPDEQAEIVTDIVALYKKCDATEKQHLFDIEKEGLRLTKKWGHLNPNYDKNGEIKTHQKKVNKAYDSILKKHDV